MFNDSPRLTRGSGLLETLLAKLRFYKARSLLSQVNSQGKILDIGCGSFPFALSGFPHEVKFGIDQSLTEEVIESLRTSGMQLSNADFTQGLPYEDNSFDVVTMLAAIEHIDHPAEVVKEVGRVLKSGGYFVMTTPSSWTEPILTFLARIGLLSKEELDEHRDLLTPGQLLAMCFDAGFRPEDVKIGTFELGLNQWVRARR